MKYKSLIFISIMSLCLELFAQSDDAQTTLSTNYQSYSYTDSFVSIKRIIVDAYQKEFGYDSRYDPRYMNVNSISFDEIKRICHEVASSDTCNNIPEEKAYQMRQS